MSNLKGKNIIVTGASGGIGNSIIKKLNDNGANILASGTRIEKLDELKKKFGTSFYNISIYTKGGILLNPAKLSRSMVDSLPENVELFENKEIIL